MITKNAGFDFEPLKDKGKSSNQYKINILINSGYLRKEEYASLRSLGFKPSIIIKEHLKVKKILELLSNRLNISFISFGELKSITKKNDGNIDLIINEVKSKIDIDSLSSHSLVLVQSILNIENNG